VTPQLRKLFFEALYRNRYLYRFASTVPFAGQWRVWQRLVLSRVTGSDVLELGCGLGDLLADLLARGYRARAVEQSPQMVAAARDTLRRRKLGTPSLVIQGSAGALPFGDATFDTVVSTFPSEYIYDDNTLSEVERVLRPGGRLIVIEGANLLPVGLLQSLLFLIQLFVYGPDAVYGPRQRHTLAPEVARRHADSDLGADITTEVVLDAWFGRHIPLEQHHLRRRSELVRSRRWEVYITIGEKQV
jgi:SAM-dependent methyltransferase